jgi:hypothetical protein
MLPVIPLTSVTLWMGRSWSVTGPPPAAMENA